MTQPQRFEADAKPGDVKIDPILVANLNQLIGPNLMPVEDQVATLRDMWQTLGHEMPEPAEQQLADMGWKASSGWETTHKVLIFPFEESYAASQARLQEITKTARAVTPLGFTDRQVSPLITPLHVREPGGWKHEVAHVDHGPRVTHRALYKTPEGLVDRGDFLTRMGEEGRVLVDQDGKTWMYTVMDLHPLSGGAEAGVKVSDLHEEVDYALVPEALVTMQLAHKLAGAEGQPLTADVANETIVFNSDKHPKNRFITTVGLGSDTKRILLSYDHTDVSSPHGGYGIRAGGGNVASLEQVA